MLCVVDVQENYDPVPEIKASYLHFFFRTKTVIFIKVCVNIDSDKNKIPFSVCL